LRRAARRLRGTPCSGWLDDRYARHWLHTLTVRLGVPAHPRVTRLADGVFHAEIDEPYSWAVEATPGAALAFAALGAVGAGQVPAAGHVAMPSGALARLTQPSMMDGWVDGLAEREPGLCARLQALVGRPRPAESAAYLGFTVLDVPR